MPLNSKSLTCYRDRKITQLKNLLCLFAVKIVKFSKSCVAAVDKRPFYTIHEHSWH